MARARKSRGAPAHKFSNKLLLNQWLISLFGIDPLLEQVDVNDNPVRPFHKLAEFLTNTQLEGLDADNLHRFYHQLINSHFFWGDYARISQAQLLVYEENVVGHTQAINQKRERPIVWKYFQWLALIFTELYLERYFNDRAGLLAELNDYVARFNAHWTEYADVPPFGVDDLNKLCYQNATGSGKTLLMHVNLRQFRHYAERSGQADQLSRVILLTPNERLSEQHLAEFQQSDIPAAAYLENRGGLFAGARGLAQVDVLQITSLADEEGPNTVATRSLGDGNLLLVDEGHRGMSGKEEGVWLQRRAMLCEKGFTFEYSATFAQAVAAAKNPAFENSYAKSILFDYSYRWFYGDGFGKDYRILNLPHSPDEVQAIYLTACLLKFYQQLRLYGERRALFAPFNLEKPLWVFVGSTVSGGKLSKEEDAVATDVAQIVHFIAAFLTDSPGYQRRISEILTSSGQDTGLLDAQGNDIFAGSFVYLQQRLTSGESVAGLYRDILARLFNNPAGGQLRLSRVKGDAGEIVLSVGLAEEAFGLINVGDAKALSDHLEAVAARSGVALHLDDSDFTEALFAGVKDSSSPVNLLIGSKKFIEGWDCWRVSTMGLMHVGRSEGAQIIQLFGRGVRLKGYDWSLKRSGHSQAAQRPDFIHELETLHIFGIEADFMAKFRDYLAEEGLPGNERQQLFTVPLNVTYNIGKGLKTLRPKRKPAGGGEYDFKQDGPIPTVGEVPAYLQQNPVEVDWYPRIQALHSRQNGQTGVKERAQLAPEHLALLDFDALYFELEQYKRERAWHNLNIPKDALPRLLADSNWYTLYLPAARLRPTDFSGVRLLQQVAAELLRRYADRYYNYCKRAYIEPRLELRELALDDENFPTDKEYQLIVDGSEAQTILNIQQISQKLQEQGGELLREGDLQACNFGPHLYKPLFHVRKGGKVTVLPVALGQSEYQFVEDLKDWWKQREAATIADGWELYLLRNLSRGKGVGFFEAGGFYPDFLLWLLRDGKQYVTFVDPHGLQHEGPGSEKVHFAQRIKEVERRLGDPNVILNSFILSWTPHPQLQWGQDRAVWEQQHVLFMTDDRAGYVGKLFAALGSA